jgi:hypothetical protein
MNRFKPVTKRNREIVDCVAGGFLLACRGLT